MAKVYPAVCELDHLSTSLNIGERQVLNALLALDDEWLIYVQPRFGWDQPDFVVAHPQYGVCAIEVKDWSLGMYRQAANGAIEVCANGGWRRTAEAPRFQAHRYRNTIFERFFAHADSPVKDFSLVRSIVVMVRHRTTEARDLLKKPQISASAEDRVLVWGGGALVSGLLPVVTGQVQPTPRQVPVESFDRLRRYLAEAEGVSDQRLPLSLSDAAMNIESNPNSAKIRRVRGAAGCGKSLGLAARAARLAAEGKDVLVVTFNSTLPHYLHDLAARRCREVDGSISRITFSHLHGLCSRTIEDAKIAGYVAVSGALPGMVDQFEEHIDRANDAYTHGHGHLFDAVLVDEGQDFSLKWWNLLRRNVCKPDGEMLLVADPTQDLYGKRAWTDERQMVGAGFNGPWAELRGSYRMPPDLIPLIANFAALHLVGDKVEPSIPPDHPLAGVYYEPTVRRWVNSEWGQLLGDQLGQEVLKLLSEHPDLAPSDVVYLAPSHAVGLQAAKVIAGGGFDVNHVFGSSDAERRRRKDRFWSAAPGVKGCTTHSFKGWESRAVVLSVDANEASHRLAYVGLTRVKGDPHYRAAFVTVVNSDRKLRSFREQFEQDGRDTP